MTTARDAHYIAIPAFVSRLFRHSGIYIRTTAHRPPQTSWQDHRAAGISDHRQCLDQGILKTNTEWRPTSNGGRRLEEPGRDERASHQLPPAIDCRPFRSMQLSQMLRGRARRLISARAPSCFLHGPRHGALSGLFGDRGGLFSQDRHFSDHACDRHPRFAGAQHPCWR